MMARSYQTTADSCVKACVCHSIEPRYLLQDSCDTGGTKPLFLQFRAVTAPAECRGVAACRPAPMAKIILPMANIDPDRRNLWRKLILHGGEYTVIGDVRTVLIVNESIWG